MKRWISLLLALAVCLGLGGAALASTDDGDLYEPQAWFGDWADAYELAYWDYAGDENSTGLILHFSSQPEAGLQLFQVYADRLRENGELREDSRLMYDSDCGDYDQEVCYTYVGPEDVGPVTSLLGEKQCELFLDSLWMDEDLLAVVVTWGDGFPMRVDMDGLDYLPGDPGTTGGGSGSVTYDANSTYLPSPDAWFDGQLARDEDTDAYGGHLVSYKMDLEDLPAVEAYVKLLAEDRRFQLEMADSSEEDFTEHAGQKYYSSYFRYTGSASTGTVDYNERVPDCAVAVAYSEDFDQGTCSMTVCYASEFTLVDDGDRCGLDVTDRLGGSASSSGGSSFRSDGGSSSGSGGGSSSGGGSTSSGPSSSGGHWEWRTVEKDCPSCVGGRCPVCNGTGVYRLYGEAVPCRIYCSSCNGLGTITQQEYVYVPG